MAFIPAIALAALSAVPSAAASGLGALASGLGATTIGSGLTGLGSAIGGLGTAAGQALGAGALTNSLATTIGTSLGNVVSPLAEGVGGFLTGGGGGELLGGVVDAGAAGLETIGLGSVNEGIAGLATNLQQGIAPYVTGVSDAMMLDPTIMGPMQPAGGELLSQALTPIYDGLGNLIGTEAAAVGGEAAVSTPGVVERGANVLSNTGTAIDTLAPETPNAVPPVVMPPIPIATQRALPGYTTAMSQLPAPVERPNTLSLASQATRPVVASSRSPQRAYGSGVNPASNLGMRLGRTPPPTAPPSARRSTFVAPSNQGRMVPLQERLFNERMKRYGY